MVKYEELFNMVHGESFRPFRIFVKDGRIIDIPRKFNNVVTKSFMAIGVPRVGDMDPMPIAATTIHLPLEMIDRVEFLRENQPSMQG